MAKKNYQISDEVTDWIQIGAGISGNVASAILGFATAGLPGAIVAGSMSPILTEVFAKVGKDLKSLAMTPREEVRIGAALTFALAKIEQKSSAGEKTREDEHFKDSNNDRAASKEILEAALQFAQKEHEELKVKHYGYLVANIYYDQSIDRGFANLLLRLAGTLSFRQLCLLALFESPSKYNLFIPYKPDESYPDIFKSNYLNQLTIGRPHIINPLSWTRPLKERKPDLGIELKELEQLELTYKDAFNTSLGAPELFSNMHLTPIGQSLASLMELREISQEHIETSAKILRFTENHPPL